PVPAAIAAPVAAQAPLLQGYHGPMGKHHDPCIDPKHHVDDAASFVAAVQRACSERGLRLTPIRERVLELIAGQGKPVKAYDLLEMLKPGASGDAVGAAAPPTIYRALDFLLANGFIHKLESVN